MPLPSSFCSQHFKCVCAQSLSRVQLLVTPSTAARQAPLSMEFSRQEYWSRLPFPTPGDLSDPGVELASPALQVDSLPLSHQGSLMFSVASSYGAGPSLSHFLPQRGAKFHLFPFLTFYFMCIVITNNANNHNRNSIY